MKKMPKRNRRNTLFLSIILVFCILGLIVLSVARKISAEMSTSAIHNLSASLGLIKNTIESILIKETEFQLLIAQEIASSDDPYEFIRSYKNNHTLAKLSLILPGRRKVSPALGKYLPRMSLIFLLERQSITCPSPSLTSIVWGHGHTR